MSRVSALSSSKALLATLALLGGLSLGAMTALAATQSRAPSGPTAVDVAPVSAIGPSTVDAVVGSAVDQAVENAVDQAVYNAVDQAQAGKAAGRVGLRRLLIGKTERAEITIATDAGTKTILYARGEISAVSATSITISLSDGRHETFTIDPSTIVREKGKQISPAELSRGERAMVFGLRSADGSYTARLVRCVQQARNPAKPDASASPGA